MALLRIVLTLIETFNDLMGRIGRVVSVVALALMVLIILTQVFFRYIMNNALPWPDEAARFLMLWLTGLMVPIALRQGSMVAITTLHDFLPQTLLKILTLALLLISLMVLMMAVKLGWAHVNSGWLFASATLKLPLDWIGFSPVKIKLAWMYMSLFVGCCLMAIVNIELILKTILLRPSSRQHTSTPLRVD